MCSSCPICTTRRNPNCEYPHTLGDFSLALLIGFRLCFCSLDNFFPRHAYLERLRPRTFLASPLDLGPFFPETEPFGARPLLPTKVPPKSPLLPVGPVFPPLPTYRPCLTFKRTHGRESRVRSSPRLCSRRTPYKNQDGEQLPMRQH